MREQSTHPDFKGQRVWIGLDVAKKSWKVAIVVGTVFHRAFAAPPDPRALARYLHRNFPGASFLSVYEAGYCGFWIQKALITYGVPCLVTNPADVPTTHKEKTGKTDRVDTLKLVRSLMNGDLRGIYIPSTAALRARSLVRMRGTFVCKQTRCKNQIKAYLEFYGERPPEDLVYRHWSRRYIAYLEKLQRERQDEALGALLSELLYLRGLVKDLTRTIRVMTHEPRYREDIRLLMGIPGIGMTCGMTLLTEIVTMGRFRRFERLCSYVGLVPTEHSSGESQKIGSLTPRRSRFLRSILIEAAWAAVRQDPELLRCFTELSKRMRKTDAIIRIARKLLARIRFVLKHREPYTTTLLTE
jgi:transposase